jgi:transposase, IS30 family
MKKKFTHLSIDERSIMVSLLQQGASQKEIAKKINRSESTISREIKRNLPKEPFEHAGYHAYTAQKLAEQRKSDASAQKRIPEKVWKIVKELLQLQWSPQAISERVEQETSYKVSHESIYQFVYKDRKNGGCLYQNLRQSHRKRRKRFPKKPRVAATSVKRSIEVREKVINNRGRLGDFEGDTVVGANHKAYFLTLVDRLSRYVIIKKMDDKCAETTCDALMEAVQENKKSFHSLTLDNGTEFANFEYFESCTGIKTYFAHPYSSYERGTNENTNGLIRQYAPKKTDFSGFTQEETSFIEDRLNHRPRRVLGYKTPYEVHFGVNINYILKPG